MVFFCLRRLVGRVLSVGFARFFVGLGKAAFWLFACGVGLSLHSYRSIRFAPVRGSTHFLCRRKESKQRKRASNRQPVGVHLGHPLGTAQGETRSRAAPVRDKALIRSSVALRAPPSGTTLRSSRSGTCFRAARPATHQWLCPTVTHKVRGRVGSVMVRCV